ncbi:thioesterase [Mycolicibacterium litorale]|uniref:Thioesterase n=1 Tax=Mycolicibacterium litorale TaxID=758802 RepID=A0A6S6P895_9MYCO|nr:alpha/beta fold hydrolase [Mycolicibacterium litorale]BCI54306.1 thioesterase [Mycolicibacterium litorale]
MVDGIPMSGLMAEGRSDGDPRAVVVALHGGASTASYFDCPGHPRLSLLRVGAQLGFTVIALDRPGYGSSAPYPEALDRPEQRVALAYGAVDAMLGQRSTGAGVFVVGHSNGCELALRMAADDRGIGLLGLELAGTGLRYQDAALEILRDAGPTRRPPGLRQLLWEPAELYPRAVLSGITNSSTGAPYEAAMVADWPQRDFPALAGRVRIPVRFSHAEHERVWCSDPEALARIAGIFTAAARFVTAEQSDAGHNLSLGVTAAAYHLKVLSFVEECVVTRDRAGRVDVEVG